MWENFSCPTQQEKLAVRQNHSNHHSLLKLLRSLTCLVTVGLHIFLFPGACTSALLKVLNGQQPGQMSWVQVLRQMRSVLNGMGFDVSHLVCFSILLMFVVGVQHIVFGWSHFRIYCLILSFGLLANSATYQVRSVPFNSSDWYLVDYSCSSSMSHPRVVTHKQ